MRRRLFIYTMAAGMAFGALSGCTPAGNAGQTTAAAVTAGETTGTSAVETNEVPISQATGEKEVGPGVTAETPKLAENVLLWGPVIKVDKEYNRISLDNRAQGFPEGEIVLNISSDKTRVLDAVDGLPTSLDDIMEGQIIYAYAPPIMTMSLPPITSPSMILCRIPADFRVPEYVTVSSMAKQEDGSYKLTSTSENEYAVPADCSILPFLTRNMVYLENVTEGSKCLLWMNESNQVRKIVLFADADVETAAPTTK